MTGTLTIRGLAAGYGGRQVLCGLDLAPWPGGGITALVGPNAAGKSTLLRVLAGLVPARGAAQFGAAELIAMPAGPRSSLVGFVPQALPGDAALGVLESVVVALKASGHAAGIAATRARALDTLDRLGIADLGMAPLGRLSGGQRQLAGIAQAVARRTPLLLLDEPTSALDLHYQLRVLDLAREAAAERGMTVMIVLHDLQAAARVSDRIAVMAKGRLVAFGTPDEAITPDILAEVYRVSARVQRCDRGVLQVMIDDVLTA